MNIPVLFYSSLSFLSALKHPKGSSTPGPRWAAAPAVGGDTVCSQEAEALLYCSETCRGLSNPEGTPSSNEGLGNPFLQHPATPHASLLIAERCVLPSSLERGSTLLFKSPFTPRRQSGNNLIKHQTQTERLSPGLGRTESSPPCDDPAPAGGPQAEGTFPRPPWDARRSHSKARCL